MDWLTDGLKFITEIPGDLWNLIPTLGLPPWLAWLPKVAGGLLGVAGITRIIPDKWMYVPITQFFDKVGLAVGLPIFAVGKAVSEAGRGILGKRRWEKIETQVLEKALMVFYTAIFDGMNLLLQRIRNAGFDGLDQDDNGA